MMMITRMMIMMTRWQPLWTCKKWKVLALVDHNHYGHAHDDNDDDDNDDDDDGDDDDDDFEMAA